ncbi:MAG: hypothetical protein F6J98_21780 [Moorea sp. SIO4G2]|nr:hypothetical protein [Moorena sp. SIO4G2]
MSILSICKRSLLAEAEAVGHALRSRSVGFAETLHRVAWPTANRISLIEAYRIPKNYQYSLISLIPIF